MDAPVAPGGVSPAIRRACRRISARTGCRPRVGAGRRVQRWATRRRCQPITVAGCTIRNTSRRRVRSNAVDNTARMVRSVSLKTGRATCRYRTRTWRRSARISASRSSPAAKQPTEAAQHQTGDRGDEVHGVGDGSHAPLVGSPVEPGIGRGVVWIGARLVSPDVRPASSPTRVPVCPRRHRRSTRVGCRAGWRWRRSIGRRRAHAG